MEQPKDIIEELSFNDKWLTDEYKCSRYYREYLANIFNVLNKTYQ